MTFFVLYLYEFPLRLSVRKNFTIAVEENQSRIIIFCAMVTKQAAGDNETVVI